MNGWTESTIRSAAAWQAFKEGKAIFESGLVAEVKLGSAGWQGVVKMGNRMVRVSVVAKSATNIEARCPCADNQRSGAFCAHAVASGLAAIAPKSVSKPASKPAPAAAAPSGKSLQPPAWAVEAPAAAWQILLPLNWREALKRGKFAATLATVADEEVSAADERLHAWLQKEKVAIKSLLSLHLDAARIPAFLEAVAEHPRFAVGRDQLLVQIRAGERLKVAGSRRVGDTVVLTPDPGSGPWVEIGATFWHIDEENVTRIGQGAVPASLTKPFGELVRGESVTLAAELFFEQLGTWQEWIAFPKGDWLERVHFIPAAFQVAFEVEGSIERLEARISVEYGVAPAVAPGVGKVAGLPRLAGEACEIRDLAGEEKVVRRLSKAGFEVVDYSNGRWVLAGESLVLPFLTHVLPQLRKEWKVKEGERFAKARSQVAVVTPKIEILGSGTDWLQFDLSFETTVGGVISAAEVRQLLRAGRGSGVGAGGRHLVISKDVAEVVDPLFSDLDLRQDGGHFTASARAGEVVREIRKKLQNKNDESDLEMIQFESPPTLRAELRPYQAYGARWMYDRVERFGGALLADDMGLGKTLQTIALIERLFQSTLEDSGVVVVVATASLLGNWKAEFGRFAPGRKVRILHGGSRDAERERVESGEVVLTSYGTLARDLAWYLKRAFRAVVVDEASLMRNPDTDHAKAIAKLKASRRVALTGTPVENGVRDLWSIFRFIQPGWLGGREEFKQRYEQPLVGAAEAAGVMERLRLKTGPFLLRRTKEQVAPELPSKIFIDEFCDLTADQQAVYKELLVEGRKRVDAISDTGNKGAARMQMLTALLRLRQTCCDLALLGNDSFKRLLVTKRSAKLARLLELVEEAVNGNHRMLVFSQFQTQLQEIEKCIREKGWDSLRLDGQTRNRQQLVDRFQQPDGPPVFLISLKAGGYGLNLTAADTVVHFDPWWNPAAEAQATDRAHRIGQTRPVTVYRMLTRGTVEEKVVQLQAKKRELASAIDDENGVGDAAGWSLEELQSVIVGDGR